MSQNVNQLLQNAVKEGSIQPVAMQALTLVDVGTLIQGNLGIPAIDVKASEVILVSDMLDDSGSIDSAGNTQVVRDGHNLVIDSLMDSKQKDNILMHTRYLNGLILFPYCPLKEAVRLDANNYDPRGGTPLYDETAVFLGTVLAKTQEFMENGVSVRTVSLITTDGHDLHSRKIHDPAQLKPIISGMLMQENHIIAAMGVDDRSTDFRGIFRAMGIEDKWILTPSNTPSEIRKAFQLFSSSAVRASQNAASFSQTALGGFNTK